MEANYRKQEIKCCLNCIYSHMPYDYECLCCRNKNFNIVGFVVNRLDVCDFHE